jgi:hypothetical protein
VFSVDNLNPAAAISGTSFDANNVWHGFLRTADGTITTFDAPGAGTGAGQGTTNDGINQAGTIEGAYAGANTLLTASFALVTARSPLSTYRAPAQAPALRIALE